MSIFTATSEESLQALNELVLHDDWRKGEEADCDTALRNLLASQWAGEPAEFETWWAEFNDGSQQHTAQEFASALHVAIIQKCWRDGGVAFKEATDGLA